ncbi:hypothetical protein PspLS_10888 [Pyricularia sp. CBS 133598]|nr:hypothetical protein PspLS_10888 [Pyricularia sp. CBS 133598]
MWLQMSLRGLALIQALALPSIVASQQPFMPAATPYPGPPLALVSLHEKRQNGCVENTYSCADRGPQFNNICCGNGLICSLDAANQPACCPQGAVCTGTAPASFRPPAPSASFVPNQFFPFAYITTSFSNKAACETAVSQCSRNYDVCTSQLNNNGQAGGNGVTIIVPGGAGTTIGVSRQNLGPSSATSICGSLSSQACFGIQPTVCSSQGTVNNGQFFVGSANAGPARPTPPPALLLGVGLGVMGIL